MVSGGELMQTDVNSTHKVVEGGRSADSKNIITRSEALKRLKIMLKDDTKLLKKVMSLAESLANNGCRYVGDASSKGVSKQNEISRSPTEKPTRSRG